jgi:guanylate kinase
VVAYIREHHPAIWHSVSVTTRDRREGEVEGVDRYFVTPERFALLVEAEALLEHAEYAGHHYGTPREAVEERRAAGISVLLEIEIQGARQVRRLDPEALLVFLAPPSWEELERRLRGRGTEDPAVIRRRLDQARIELAAAPEFDEVLVNTSVAEVATQLIALMGLT